MLSRARALGLALCLVLVAARASAYDAAVDGTFDAQLYQVTSPYGDPILRRRRYIQTLTLRLNDLQGAHVPGGPEVSAMARLRLDADIGQDPNERATDQTGRLVPGLDEMPLDVMTAYVEGRNYAGGLLGFRLGRQYVFDPLGIWSFDGALVRLSTPAYFAVEAYGGFEQRGGLPMLSTPRFESDGVLRGGRSGMPQELWPAYLNESRLAPAWGVSAESTGLDWLTTRLSYRRVINRDSVVVAPFADAAGRFPTMSDSRVATEKVGWSGSAVLADLGALRGSFVYDLLRTKTTGYGASADAFVTRGLDVGADLDYFLPTFDGDSIWNWFAHGGTTSTTARVRWDASRRITLSGSFGGRHFDTSRGDEARWDVLGTTSAGYRYPEGSFTLRATDEQGSRGHVRGADLYALRRFEGGLYDASAIVSLYDWDDPLRPDRSATSFTYVLGAGHRPFDRTRVGLEWEHSMNQLVGQRFRALATLAVTVY